MRILWAALLGSLGVYVAVLMLGAPEPAEQAGPEMIVALVASAVFCAVISFLLPRLLLRKALAAQTFETVEVPDPDASVMFRDATPMVRAFADPEAVERKLGALSFAPFIISLALSEAIGAFGLVLGLTGAPVEVVAGFFATSAVLIAIRFPRPKAALAQAATTLGVKLGPAR